MIVYLQYCDHCNIKDLSVLATYVMALSSPLWMSKIRRVVTNHSGPIGGTKLALPFASWIVCHFGATYMDGMTGDCEGFEIPTVGYF